MKSPEEIRSELDQFTGTEHYYRHFFGVVYTDGVKYLSEQCQCFWLFDAIASWQTDPKVMKEEFQVWKLKVLEDKSAILSCEDGNYNVIVTQEIEYTDFPLDSITVFFANSTLYLPSEH